MRVLEKLEPNRVFHFFEDLTEIPHGSMHTKAISDYFVKFAEDRGLKYSQDSANNVIIKKTATPGYEKAEPVIIQGHMDMICEKNPGCSKNMEKEGLDLFVDGDLIGAKDTTLGGDDGIAVAMALAILDAREIPHPALEVVFTVDEEIGMLGAAAIDCSELKGRRMLNLDSEEEGILTVSCAGGNESVCELPLTRQPFTGTKLTVTVGGLIGGHSGAEIDKGRGNSNMLMGRVLFAIRKQAGLRLIAVSGGTKNNAIPGQTIAQIVTADAEDARRTAEKMDKTFKHEYQTTDPDVFVKAEAGKSEGDMQPMDEKTTATAICFLTCAPNGIQVMSQDIKDLVQTSLNLGILKTDAKTMSGSFSVRSSISTQREMLVDRLSSLMEELGGTIRISGEYPGWEYQKDSALRKIMVDVYKEQYGSEPVVAAIHAGLECGLFSGKLPGLDCVSYGPNLLEVHTPRERMSISSVQRVWKYTLEVLKRCR